MSTLDDKTTSTSEAVGLDETKIAHGEINSLEDEEKKFSKVLTQGNDGLNDGLYVDPTAQSKLRRKLDTHIMPLLFVLCK
jgi:hypothetical protein